MAMDAFSGMFCTPKKKLTMGGEVKLETFNKANFFNVEALLGYYGDDKMSQLGVGSAEDEKKIQKGLDKILKYLMLPFPEQEEKHLEIIKNLLTIPRCLTLFCKNKDGIDYLVRKPAENFEIFNLKKEVTDYLLKEVKAKSEVHGNSFFVTYLEFFTAAQLGGKIENMHVMSDTN